MKKIAYLFPGQGAQYTNMAMDLISSNAVVSLFKTASDILGKDIKEILGSDAEILKRTDVSQPAITAANLAAAVYLNEKGFTPSACAGFSLGEYAALVCAGVIETADCFRLIKARGEAMQKAADNLQNKSGMAAVVGLAPDQVESLIAKWRKEEGVKDLYAANINSYKQLVISGTDSALAEAETRFKEAGAKRVLRLQVAGPFHSPLIKEAVEDFKIVLEKINFNDPKIAVFSNVTGKQILTGSQAKELALLQITSPVRWVDEQASIAAYGVDVCFEVGPGSVLQGLWNDTKSEIPIYAAGTANSVCAQEIEKILLGE